VSRRRADPIPAGFVDGGAKVPCECCAGTGQRRLRPKESLALAGAQMAAEASDTGWATTGAVAALLPKRIGRGALLYRLAHLEELGLLESRRARAAGQLEAYGNEKEWRRKPGSAST
jgi:hypothetical protein